MNFNQFRSKICDTLKQVHGATINLTTLSKHLLLFSQMDGVFAFVQKLWSGNISDRKITIDSKYLDNISPRNEVMADRGDLLTLNGAYLNMLPFTRERKNGIGRVLTSKQIIEKLLPFESMLREL